MSQTYYPDKEEFIRRSKSGNLVSVYREILADMETPVSAFKKIGTGEYSFLLESVEGGERMARFSFLGGDVSLVIRSRGKKVEVIEDGQTKTIELEPGQDPLHILKTQLSRFKWVQDPELPKFCGGAVGYMGYDMVRFFEDLPDNTEDDLNLDDCIFVFTDTLLIFDHVKHKIKVLCNAQVNGDPSAAYDKAVGKIEALVAKLKDAGTRRHGDAAKEEVTSDQLPVTGIGFDDIHSGCSPSQLNSVSTPEKAGTEGGHYENYGRSSLVVSGHPCPETDGAREASGQGCPEATQSSVLSPQSCEITSNFTRDAFEQAVSDCKEYIAAGDVIQVVLSQRLSVPVSADPFDVYRALRSLNPSPYMYFLSFGNTRIIGSSPEILVTEERGKVTVRPIAGTRRRGKTELEDKELETELLKDEKERAEHIMLVDLGRNDIGRVCRYGSVSVNELMVIERYSHVMHIVSNVQGRLKPDKDQFDVLRATFPAGTVSGAPKIRAMEIIDELEPTRRGTYAGAIGYFSFSGDMDTCITIRTILIKDGRAYVQAGAGIVADSVPASEYQETMNKASAMIKALELAENGLE